MGLTRHHVCDRVRSQISLGLDGELSQLERRMVAGHLERCQECLEFERSVTEFTLALRSAPAERPARRLVLPRRRRISLVQTQVGVAAALLVAVLGTVSQLTSGEVQRPGAFPAFEGTVRFDTTTELTREIALILNGSARANADSGSGSGSEDDGPKGSTFAV